MRDELRHRRQDGQKRRGAAQPAGQEGPQRVTVRGHDAVVVIAADEHDRLLPPASDAIPFLAFMEAWAWMASTSRLMET